MNTVLFVKSTIGFSENLFLVLSSYCVPKLRYVPLTLNIKTFTTSHDNINLIICVYALNRTNMLNYTFKLR